MNGKDQNTAYDVAVAADATSLNWQPAGPLFKRYAVSLAGHLDRRWVDCYRRLTERSAEYARFRIEPAAGEVSFTTRTTDSAVQVMGVLKKLESLVQLVNKEATCATASPRPQEAAPEPPKSRFSDLAARFGLKKSG